MAYRTHYYKYQNFHFLLFNNHLKSKCYEKIIYCPVGVGIFGLLL
jgi:hypothetical protein